MNNNGFKKIIDKEQVIILKKDQNWIKAQKRKKYDHFTSLDNAQKILKNKQLHTIQKIKNEWDITNFSFSDLLEDMDTMYKVTFDDKEVYNFSDLLRKPIYKPVKQNKRKQYQKHLKHIFSIYKRNNNRYRHYCQSKHINIVSKIRCIILFTIVSIFNKESINK